MIIRFSPAECCRGFLFQHHRAIGDAVYYYLLFCYLLLFVIFATFCALSLFLNFRNFAQNHEYFENNEAIREYLAEYEKWFENVYMDKDFAAEDKDPLDVYTEYFRQNHMSGGWL